MTDAAAAPASAAPRAPRLDPETHIARRITRRGRFAKLDPLRPRARPSVAKMLGVVGWLGLTGYSWWKARQQALPAQSQ